MRSSKKLMQLVLEIRWQDLSIIFIYCEQSNAHESRFNISGIIRQGGDLDRPSGMKVLFIN